MARRASNSCEIFGLKSLTIAHERHKAAVKKPVSSSVHIGKMLAILDGGDGKLSDARQMYERCEQKRQARFSSAYPISTCDLLQ